MQGPNPSSDFVILAGDAAVAPVVGIPLVRRHVLCAERAHARGIWVLCAPATFRAVRRLLRDTRARVRRVAQDELPARLKEHARRGAVLLSDDWLIDETCARALGEQAGPGDLAWPASAPLPCVAEPMRTCSERRLATTRLCQSVFKPTDNWFARANRRVSLPISRLLVKTPLSPNAVSFIGLGFSVAAGLCYAFGGYGFSLLGAFLSWFSSMLDGCDGEVARLTFRETALGCWLESVCDDLYYVAVLLGMGLGLYSEDPAFAMVVGGLALTGFLTTSIVHLTLRARIAARGGPSKFGAFFAQRMDELAADPLVRFARRTYRIGTRSTAPYLFFALALIGQTRLALLMVALSAHLYWALSLYIWWAPSPATQTSPEP